MCTYFLCLSRETDSLLIKNRDSPLPIGIRILLTDDPSEGIRDIAQQALVVDHDLVADKYSPVKCRSFRSPALPHAESTIARIRARITAGNCTCFLCFFISVLLLS